MAEKLDIAALLAEPAPAFESRPFHSPAGDCLYYYFENAEHVADRVDCWLTVYYATDDQRLVGFKLKNIRTLLSRFDQLHLQCMVRPDRWKINLKAVVTSLLHVAPDPLGAKPAYQNVMQMVLIHASDDAVELEPEPEPA